jgi:small GTP-binding protein
MSETHSADSRARLRASFGLPRSGSHNPYNPHSGSTPGLSRALTDVGVTPPRGAADRGAAPDLGGPDGLEAKVVLLGSQGVGKTSLILRYTTRAFDPTPHAATIGSSLHTRKLVHDGVRVKLQIWDTAGQERFRSMAPIYYRGAHVCVLVYDTTDRQSFEDVRSWLDELGRTVPKDTVIFVAGAKIDRPDRQVT